MNFYRKLDRVKLIKKKVDDMSKLNFVVLTICFSMLCGCSGKSGGAPEVKEAVDELNSSARLTQEEKSFPMVKAVYNLSSGATGFVAKQMGGLRNESGEVVNMSAAAASAEVMIFNAAETSSEIIEQANAFLKNRKRLIVDSDGTPEGKKAVRDALSKILGGSAIDADAALVTYYNATDYSITPIDINADSLGKGDDGHLKNGNTVPNILGLGK